LKCCILDTETDSLEPTVVWVAGVKDLQTGEKFFYRNPDVRPEPLAQKLEDYDRIIGHNVLAFDSMKVLGPLCKIEIPLAKIIDTLVLSRLINFSIPGGHSAEAWGKRLGQHKLEFSDFSRYSKKMAEYLSGDLDNHEAVYLHFKRFVDDPSWQKAIEIEHHSAWVCEQLHHNGFLMDVPLMNELYAEVLAEIAIEDKKILESIPPRVVKGKEVQPRVKKDGSLSAVGLNHLDNPNDCWGSHTTVNFESFNPASPKQRTDLLWDAGWKPTEKTKTYANLSRQYGKYDEKDQVRLAQLKKYGWTTSEENLSTLPESAPEGAKVLVRWLALNNRRLRLEEWFRALKDDGRIHGQYLHIGAWTHRKAHSAPNQANIPRPFAGTPQSETDKVAAKYNARFRQCFTVEKDRWLVGTDAEGIQLRILAHLMQDEDYINAVVNGRKEDESDVHNVNRRALGLDHITRDDTKTFIYAWLLGAQDRKVASILRVTPQVAKTSMASFLERLPALKRVKQDQIPAEARQGYFVGMDGRKVVCSTERLVLAGHLQCNESIVMKHATRLWMKELDSSGINYKIVNDVHDEWQTSVEGTKEEAEYVGQVQSDAIRSVGVELGCLCPLAGSYSIGHNWYETH